MMLPDHPATDPREPMPPEAITRQLGDHLRRIRLQQDLSLQAVQDCSGGEFKLSILGAYERGERAISVPRLLRLAAVYGVPATRLLPPTANQQLHDPAGGTAEPFRVNLRALAGCQEPEARTLARYVLALQAQRGDFNNRVLTLRTVDLHALAAALGRSPEGLATRLRQLGLYRPPG